MDENWNHRESHLYRLILISAIQLLSKFGLRTDVTNRTESVAARIESDSKTKLTRAAEECDLTVSAYLETVIEEHIDRNPRDLRALELSPPRDPDQTTTTTSEKSPDGFVEEMLEGLE